MLPALGAASSAVDALKSLTSSSSSSAQPAGGFAQFDIFGSMASSGGSPGASTPGGGSQISPATMSALLAAQGQSSTGATASAPTSRSAALQDLFSQIDTNGDGQISKSEFEGALGAGGTNLAQADDVFNKLDTNGDGTVNLSELKSALQGPSGKGGGHHHHHVASASGSGDSSGIGSISAVRSVSAKRGVAWSAATWAAIRSTTGFGMPRGPAIRIQPDQSNPGTVADIGGTPSTKLVCLAIDVPSARNWPLLM